ncbi:beta-microseminoprotein-like [Hippocampus zosterae]|uniref:beta-microseminoprotein-like n=1 Tax=Hippocampus zosterae TaxID=109293 RepID=UPI00223D2AE4|nr:beta-microseminoprotein-like [Hippocampus zosterae]
MKPLAEMRTYLCLALVLSAVLSLANGHCYPIEVEEGATQCLDPADNLWHPQGTTWRNSECMDCSCSGCCSAYGVPTGVPDDCVSMLDKEACEYKVFKRNDPSIECPFRGMVGK